MNDIEMKVYDEDEVTYLVDKICYTRFKDFMDDLIKDNYPEASSFADLSVKELNLVLHEVKRRVVHDYINGYDGGIDYKWELAIVDYTPSSEDNKKRYNALKRKKDDHSRGWCECYEELNNLNK